MCSNVTPSSCSGAPGTLEIEPGQGWIGVALWILRSNQLPNVDRWVALLAGWGGVAESTSDCTALRILGSIQLLNGRRVGSIARGICWRATAPHAPTQCPKVVRLWLQRILYNPRAHAPTRMVHAVLGRGTNTFVSTRWQPLEAVGCAEPSPVRPADSPNGIAPMPRRLGVADESL
jgi:hypothetical protein